MDLIYEEVSLTRLLSMLQLQGNQVRQLSDQLSIVILLDRECSYVKHDNRMLMHSDILKYSNSYL